MYVEEIHLSQMKSYMVELATYFPCCLHKNIWGKRRFPMTLLTRYGTWTFICATNGCTCKMVITSSPQLCFSTQNLCSVV